MMLEQAAFRTAPAAPENVVCAPNVRISMLTDRMVRFEWSADGKFEDRETLAVLNRDLGRVKFKTSHRDGKLVITTDSMTIELLPDGKKLSAENLNVTFELNGKRSSGLPIRPMTAICSAPAGRWMAVTATKRSSTGIPRRSGVRSCSSARDFFRVPAGALSTTAAMWRSNGSTATANG